MQTLNLTKKYEKYSEYKDSGVEWLGKIPKEWENVRGKTIFYNKKEINKGMINENVLSLTMDGVINRDYENNIGLLPSDYQTFQIFEKSDLVFKLIDLENFKTSRVGIVHEKGIMSSAYIRLIIKNKTFSQKYFFYIYYHFYIRGIYNFLGSGVRSTLNFRDLLNMNILVPGIDEQISIVNYLDEKTEMLDKIIEKKQKQIELLHEKRTMVINHAVTKGLDPKAELIESGTSWFGKIPKQWVICKLGQVGRFSASGIDKKIIEGESLVKIINYTDVYKSKDYRLIKKDYMVVSASAEKIKDNQVDIGDLIFTPSSEIIEEIGLSAIVDDFLENTAFSYHVLRFKFGELFRFNHSYKKYITNNLSVLAQFSSRAQGSIRKTLGRDDFREVKILIPDEKEQKQIAEYLDKKVEDFDMAINYINQSIELLQEFKFSLISNVVTGKIRI